MVLGVTAALSLLWGYRLMLFDHAPFAFSSDIDDMSYAWYVPVFSLYVVWRERRELAAAIGAPSLAGFLVALPFLAIGFLGIRGYQLRFEIIGFAGLIVAFVWLLFGRRAAVRVLFPAAFLLFCMPLASFLDVVTVNLRLFAVAVASAIMRGVGFDIVRQGTMIVSAHGDFAIDVAAPCSGLRSLFAMLALSAGYAYFALPSWPRRALLVVLAVPIAIAGNVARILSIAVIGVAASPDFAVGFYHDYSGYVVFLVAIMLMLATVSLIARWPRRRPASKAEAAPPTQAAAAPARLFAMTLAVVALVAALVYQGMTPAPTLAAAPSVTLGEIPGYRSEAGSMTEAEFTTLPRDTVVLRRVYSGPLGGGFMVTAVVGGREKSSIHRPEMCLPSQGFQLGELRTERHGGVDWRVMTLMRGEERSAYAYTFVNQEGFATASNLERIFRDVWDRSVCNRIDRWVMLSVQARCVSVAEFGDFLVKLKEVLP